MEQSPQHHTIIDRLFSREREPLNNNFLLIKIGTLAIVDKHGRFNQRLLNNLGDQINELRKQGIKVLVLASGTIASGEHIIEETERRGLPEFINDIIEDENYSEETPEDAAIVANQVAAIYGQPIASHVWRKAINHNGNKTAVGQLLLHDYKMRRLPSILKKAAEIGITIINGNDPAIDDEEDMHRDNDKLTPFIAHAANIGKVLFLTGTNGVTDDKDETIPWINARRLNISAKILEGKSEKGKGGMRSKIRIARSIARSGRKVAIANADEEDVILKFMRDERVGTSVSVDEPLAA